MKIIRKKKIERLTITQASIYLILFPYLYPRGFAELYDSYKAFFTAWLYLAMVLALAYLFVRASRTQLSLTIQRIAASSFFVSNIIVTAIVQGGFSEGLQTLFAWPVLCLWLTIAFSNNHTFILNAIHNIQILDLIMQLIIYMLGTFSSTIHLTYLGHVQLIGQVCLFSLLVGFLSLITRSVGKLKSIMLIVLSLIVCFIADADSAKLVLVLTIVAFMLKGAGLSSFFRRHLVFLLIGLFALSVVVIGLSTNRSDFLGVDWSLSGRNFIWDEALGLIRDSPLLGYGVMGVEMTLFWGGVMNYAHNQLLQCMLDGGLIVTVLFIVMMISYAKLASNISHPDIRYCFGCALIILMLLMIFDSVSWYPFVYMILSLISYYSQQDYKGTTWD